MVRKADIRYQLNRHNTTLRRALAAIEERRGLVLEAGCGSGRFIRAILRERPDLRAFACDIEPGPLAFAKASGDGVEYARASLTHLPYAAASFDIALLFDVLEHLEAPELGLAEIHRVLRPGGLLHALVPCEDEPLTLHWLLARLRLATQLKERHAGHIRRFTQKGLRQRLQEQGFRLLRTSYSMHPLGQLKDVLTYLVREEWAQRWHLENGIYRGLMGLLWAGAYLESRLLATLPLSAVALHISAVKVRP